MLLQVILISNYHKKKVSKHTRIIYSSSGYKSYSSSSRNGEMGLNLTYENRNFIHSLTKFSGNRIHDGLMGMEKKLFIRFLFFFLIREKNFSFIFFCCCLFVWWWWLLFFSVTIFYRFETRTNKMEKKWNKTLCQVYRYGCLVVMIFLKMRKKWWHWWWRLSKKIY